MNNVSSVALPASSLRREPGGHFEFARKIAVAGSAICALVGVCALFGWLFDFKLMKAVTEQVAPNEALGFLLAGCALFVSSSSTSTMLRLVLATLCGVVLAVVAFATVSEYLVQSDFGFDLIFTPWGSHYTVLDHGRMSFQSSVSFVLLSLGFLCLHYGSPRLLRVQQTGALLVVVTAEAAVLGHLYGFPFFTKIAYCSELSLISASAMVCAGTALFLSRPHSGLAAVFTRHTIGGSAARHLLPISALLMATFVALHAYKPQSELLLFVLLVFFGLPGLIWIAAAVLNTVELQKRQADSNIQELNQQLNEQVQQLLSSHQQINEALEARSEFLAKVSHELRTPLSGIISTTEILLTTFLSAEQRELADITLELGENLLKMINEILDFSKIDAHKIVIENIDVDLYAIVTSALESLRAKAEQKGLSLVSGIGPDVPRVIKGDPGRIRQVLVNLLDNAIKFTHEGYIVLQVNLNDTIDKQELLFMVRDTGIGIPAQFTERLFQPFVQADGSMTRRYGGSGLGLSICKSLAELMGGSIAVKSSLGDGSEFRFSIPFVRSDSPVVPTKTVVNMESITTSFKLNEILVVEDNPVNAKIAVLLLRKLGYLVDVANSGKEAVLATESKNYALVLMDVQMPEMDGLEATRLIRLREIRSKKHVPVIALTAHAMDSDREKCLMAGMQDYLTKPPKLAELSAILKRWIGKEANGDGGGEGNGDGHGNGDGNGQANAKGMRNLSANDRRAFIAQMRAEK